jgi:hypothetical protein
VTRLCGNPGQSKSTAKQGDRGCVCEAKGQEEKPEREAEREGKVAK